MTWATAGILFAIITGAGGFLLALYRSLVREPKSTKRDADLKAEANHNQERQTDIDEARYWKEQVGPLRETVDAMVVSIKTKDVAHAAEMAVERASRAQEKVEHRAYVQKLEEQIARLTLRISELEQKGLAGA